ncbi:MAG TPA: PrgI family protein [Candidatus Saccharimonadales bacterium]|nr:PrgI family protein [Candidatus Saccharimonadales bacterium]
MSSYKVIQDVEAEDKLIGPLTLRQFVYAGICAICLYLTYFTATHGLAFMAGFLVPVALITGFFAFPWGRDQPTEVWALAKIRFMIKPRRRIWNQSGIKELVTITAPKQIHVDYTNGLTQTEVRSRLRALADTIDSRGWAIKNSNLNLYTQPALIMNEPTSDRLLGPSALPQQVSSVDVQASDDILDEQNNPRAQRVDTLIAASTKAHREKILEGLRSPVDTKPETPPPAQPQSSASRNNYWFLNQPAQSTSIPANMVTFNTQVVTPGMPVEDIPNAPAAPTADEESLVHELEARKSELPTTAYYGHLHTIQPLSAQRKKTDLDRSKVTETTKPANADASGVSSSLPDDTSQAPAQAAAALTSAAQPTPPPVTPAQQAAILQLASNDDLNVATIAREAKRSAEQDEVVIKLH